MIYPHRCFFSINAGTYFATRRVPREYPRRSIPLPCIISNLDSQTEAFLQGNILSDRDQDIPSAIDLNQKIVTPSSSYRTMINDMNDYFFNLEVYQSDSDLRNAIAVYNAQIGSYFRQQGATTDEIAAQLKIRQWSFSSFPDYSDSLVAGFDAGRQIEPGIAIPRLAFLTLQVRDYIITFESGREQLVSLAPGVQTSLASRIRIVRTGDDLTSLLVSAQSKYLP